MDRNGTAMYTSEPCQPRRSNYAMFTRKGNTLYMHVHSWPGDAAVISGLLVSVKSARFLATGQPVAFQQEKLRVRFTGLPSQAPDRPLTTIAIECDAEPKQDNILVRNQHDRSNA
jgi:alpha-L-fucosidase